ncbi:MAG: septum formation protein Maf [Caulobacteraceae bacterium]|nr:septum formation protein Maf [Caulobacteraceae bacterium]
MTPIVLASASASRAALLRAAGVPFTVTPSRLDEDAVKARMLRECAQPDVIARRLAELKARAVSETSDGLVIGADQTLDLAGVLHDKPRDLAESRDRLKALRGRRHSLHAAVAVARGGEVVWSALDTASLTMRAFSDAFLDAYLERQGEAVTSSTGAYLLEGEGVQLFEAIEGDYFAILGLPLLGLLAFLREAKALPA